VNSEKIPQKSNLYRHIPKFHFNQKGKIRPITFSERKKEEGRGISSNWDRYSNPQQTLEAAPLEIEGVEIRGGVVSLLVKSILDISGQDVKHTPNNPNKAHASILGRKDEEVRLKLKQISKLILNPENGSD
jgi:hypothetical protein